MTTLEWVLSRKIIAIVRGLNTEYMIPLSDALLRGGIDLMEVTFNQKEPASFAATAEAISAVSRHMEGKMLVGAGTVLTIEQLELAVNAGAKYIITPNVNPVLIRRAKSMGVNVFPGAMTPSEILAAHDAGADFVKLFPASDLGVSYMKAIRAPISHVKLIATGGIGEKNAKDFLDAGAVGLGVGGGLANKKAIAAGDFSALTEAAKALLAAIR